MTTPAHDGSTSLAIRKPISDVKIGDYVHTAYGPGLVIAITSRSAGDRVVVDLNVAVAVGQTEVSAYAHDEVIVFKTECESQTGGSHQWVRDGEGAFTFYVVCASCGAKGRAEVTPR